jgi:RimJ/RimL family protein N-acetyltransferase
MEIQQLVDIRYYENEIRALFQKQPFGRFLPNRKIDRKGAVNFEWNVILNYSKETGYFFIATDRSEVIGFIGFHFLEWDTNIFGRKMAFIQYFIIKETNFEKERELARALLRKFHQWANFNKIQVVITKLDTQYFSPVFVLQENDYILYETVTLQSLDKSDIPDNILNTINFRYAQPSDKEQLKLIARKNTFNKSHFYLDTNFSIEKIDLMYEKWIENALESKQKIVIIEDNDNIAGVFIYEIVDHTAIMNRKFGVWKSAFVDSTYRNKGIGLKLFKATLQSCINDGVDTIDSSLVEKNIVSQNFHSKLGFRLVNTLYTLHKWFDYE